MSDDSRTSRVKAVHGLPHKKPGSGDALWSSSYARGLIILLGGVVACGLVLLLIQAIYRCAVCCRKKCCCKCRCVDRQAGRPKRWQAAVLVVVLTIVGCLSLGLRARHELVDGISSVSDSVDDLLDKFDSMQSTIDVINGATADATVHAKALSCPVGDVDVFLGAIEDVNTTIADVDEEFDAVVDKVENLQDKIDGKPYVRAYFPILLGAPFALTILFSLVAACTGDKCPAIACCQLNVMSAWAWLLGLPLALAIFAVFFVTSVFLADVCYLGIEESLQGKSEVFDYVTYYYTCEGTNPFEDSVRNATDAISTLDTYTASLDALGCSPSSTLDALDAAVVTVDSGIDNITNTLLSCSFLHDTVDELVDTAMCDKAMNGLVDSWLCLGAAGLVTLLLLFLVPCANTAFFVDPDDVDARRPKASRVAPALTTEKFI